MADPMPEATLAYFNEIVRPAYIKFAVGLHQASKDLDRWPREGAAVAIVAALTFVKNMKWDLRFWAPLEQALEILEKGIAPESLPYFKRAEAVVSNLDEYRNKPLPPVENFKDNQFLSRKDLNRIVASVVIDYQRQCRIPLQEAVRKLVGPHPAAIESLINFRDALRRTKRGIKREAYDYLKKEFSDMPPETAAQVALELYRIQRGLKKKP
jgi:hypothetical protein